MKPTTNDLLCFRLLGAAATILALGGCAPGADEHETSVDELATSVPTLEALTKPGDLVEIHLDIDPTARDLHVWRWPDGRLVVTPTTDIGDAFERAPQLVTYDLSGNALMTLPSSLEATRATAGAIDNYYVVHGSQGLTIFDLQTGETRTLSFPPPSDYEEDPSQLLVFGSESRRYAALAAGRKISVVDLGSGAVVYQIDMSTVDYYSYRLHRPQSKFFRQGGNDFVILTTERTGPTRGEPDNLLVNLTTGTLVTRRKVLDDADWQDVYPPYLYAAGWSDRPSETPVAGGSGYFFWNQRHALLIDPMKLEVLARYDVVADGRGLVFGIVGPDSDPTVVIARDSSLSTFDALAPTTERQTCSDLRVGPFDILSSNRSMLLAYNWDVDTDVYDAVTCSYLSAFRNIAGMHWHNPIIDDRGRIFQLGSRKLDTPDQGRAWGIALRLMQAD